MADSSPSRELLQRTLSGAVIVLGIIGGIYLGGTAWLCVVSALALVSLGEYYRLLGKQVRLSRGIGYICSLAVLLSSAEGVRPASSRRRRRRHGLRRAVVADLDRSGGLLRLLALAHAAAVLGLNRTGPAGSAGPRRAFGGWIGNRPGWIVLGFVEMPWRLPRRRWVAMTAGDSRSHK